MYKATINDKHQFEIERKGNQLTLNGEVVTPDVKELNPSLFHIINNNASYNVELVNFDAEAKTAEIKVNNNIYNVSVKDNFDILLEKMGLGNLTAAKVSEIKAPMPGLVLKIFVEEGAEVKKGDNLFILEAMKMENIIKCTSDVRVSKIFISAGDKVEKGQVLMSF